MRVFFTVLICFFSHMSIVVSQQTGSSIFDNDVLHEIKIEFEESNFWQILTSNYDLNYPDVPYIMANVNIDGEPVDSIGVRLKGFSSYWGSEFKKSIKLDFNEYIPGKRFDGLKKLNLNNGEGDPSMNRDMICFDVMRNNGVRAPRVAHAKVFLNDTYWGVYSLVEQIDKTFVKENFQDGNGNLFKNIGWTQLQYNGDSPNDYVEEIELKTNEDENDWSGFLNLVDVINNSTNAEFKEQIGEVFNVDLFLRTLAVDVVTNNWDSYMDHGRNFYIYEEPVSGKFQWIPWDYNLAMGGTFANSSGECDFFPDFTSFGGDDNTVTFNDQTWPGPGDAWLWDFGDGNTSTEQNPVHSYENPGVYEVCFTVFVGENCEQTYCKEVDITTSPSQCNSILNGTCPYPPDDEIFLQVINFAPTCCTGSWTFDCQDLFDVLSNNDGGGFSFPIDMQDSEKVLIQRILNVPEYRSDYYKLYCGILQDNFTPERIFPMIDQNGDLIRDAVYEDDNYIWSTVDFENDLDQGSNYVPGLKKFISERNPELESELEELYDCSLVESDYEFQDIVINEFVASNAEGGEADGNGEFDDWIELYNTSNKNIDLTEFYISDTSDYNTKWKFPPGIVMEPNTYLILWADNDTEQNGLHTDFKLSKNGEEIYLYYKTEVMDSHVYGEQEVLKSSSRIPNGTGNFTITETTFGYNNEGVKTNDLNLENLIIYPNPANDLINVSWTSKGEKLGVFVYNMLGQEVFATSDPDGQVQIDVTSWNSGVYNINITDRDGNKVTKKMIVQK